MQVIYCPVLPGRYAAVILSVNLRVNLAQVSVFP